MKRILIVLFSLFLFACNPHSPVIDTQTNEQAEVIEEIEGLPSWVVVNDNVAEGYVSYSSSNIKFDTVVPLNIFPFVVKDTAGNSGLFVLVTLNRYDMLYVGQLNVSDENNHAVTAEYVSNVSAKAHSESHLFMIDEKDLPFFKDKKNLRFNIWGIYGSVYMRLDSVQTSDVIWLANMI